MTAEFNLEAVKVGDPIVIVRSQMHRSAERKIDYGTVTKVARAYVTVESARDRGEGHTPWVTETIFRKDDGRQKPQSVGYTNYLDRAYTPADFATKERRDTAATRIDTVLRRNQFGWKDELTTDQLERIATILEEVPVEAVG